jgi:hypothetical protein
MFDLGVARSHLVALLKRFDAWIDRRTARSRSDDTPLLEDIRQVIRGLGPYGYRRVWGVLRHQHPRPNGQAANHKRVIASCAIMASYCTVVASDPSLPAGMTARSPSTAATPAGPRMGSNWLATMRRVTGSLCAGLL